VDTAAVVDLTARPVVVVVTAARPAAATLHPVRLRPEERLPVATDNRPVTAGLPPVMDPNPVTAVTRNLGVNRPRRRRPSPKRCYGLGLVVVA